MSLSRIGKILNKLMTEQNLKVSELARRANLPQPTLQRISAGNCENPHISTLQPLADYFSITVDQLKGLEPLPQFDNLSKLPLIAWDMAAHWNIQTAPVINEHIIADVPVSNNAFALKVYDSAMEPFFPQGTLLIADPNVIPKDRSYVIVLTKKSNVPIFRQLIINGPDKLLKPLSPDTDIYKMTTLKNADRIIATIVQARWNYLD